MRSASDFNMISHKTNSKRVELTKKLRFNMNYLQSHRLNASAKWLGELLLNIGTIKLA